MPDPLKNLIRELQSERCPRSVAERVANRVAARRGAARPAGRPLLGRLSWTFAGIAVAGTLGLASLRHPTPPIEPHAAPTADLASDRARVRQQAQGALLAIGRVLIQAGAHAGSTLRDEAVPPLIDSFHSTRNKLIQTL